MAIRNVNQSREIDWPLHQAEADDDEGCLLAKHVTPKLWLSHLVRIHRWIHWIPFCPEMLLKVYFNVTFISVWKFRFVILLISRVNTLFSRYLQFGAYHRLEHVCCPNGWKKPMQSAMVALEGATSFEKRCIFYLPQCCRLFLGYGARLYLVCNINDKRFNT